MRDDNSIIPDPIRDAMARISARVSAKIPHDLETYYAAIGADWNLVVEAVCAEEAQKAKANARLVEIAKEHGHERAFLKKCQLVFLHLADILVANQLAERSGYDSERYVYEPDKSLQNHRWAATLPKPGDPASTPPDSSKTDSDALSQSVYSENKTSKPVTKINLVCGDAYTELAKAPDGNFTGSVSSPTYHSIRKFTDDAREIGPELHVHDWLDRLVVIYRELRRASTPGSLHFVVLDDRYASGACKATKAVNRQMSPQQVVAKAADDIPAGNLMMLPFRLATLLVADGWSFRCLLIWDKCQSQGTAQSTTRPNLSHEYILMLENPTKGGEIIIISRPGSLGSGSSAPVS